MLAAKKLIHRLFNHFIPGALLSRPLQATVEHLTESGADEQTNEETAAQDNENNNKSGDEFIIAIREKRNRANHQIGEGFDSLLTTPKSQRKAKIRMVMGKMTITPPKSVVFRKFFVR